MFFMKNTSNNEYFLSNQCRLLKSIIYNKKNYDPFCLYTLMYRMGNLIKLSCLYTYIRFLFIHFIFQKNMFYKKYTDKT